MKKKKTIQIVRAVYPWWAGNSGHFLFDEYLSKDEFKVKTILGKQFNVFTYTRQNALTELHSFCSSMIGTDVVHFTDGELLGRFPLWRFKSKPKLMATFHQPVEILEKIARVNIIQSLDYILVVSSGQKAFFESLVPKDKIEVVLLGANTRDYLRPSRIYSNKDRLRCVSVGHYLRDYEMVYELAKKFPQVEFNVVSDQAKIDPLENINHYRGISDDDLYELYETCHLFLLPLKSGTANNAIVESLAYGLPIATSDMSSTREYLNEECTFFCRSIEDFQSTLQKCLDQREILAPMSLASRARAESISWPVIAKQMEKVYEKVIKS